MAEETKTNVTETDPATTPATTPPAETTQTPPKTFTQAELDGIVKDRLARATKDMPSKEELTAYKKWQDEQKTEAQKLDDEKKAVAASIQTANNRLVLAEIKSLDGYDTKLVAALLDKSKLTISDDGTVTGLKEAIALLETEFPAIKLTGAKQPGANPPGAGSAVTPEQEYDDAYKAAAANPRDSSLTQKLFLAKEKMNAARK